jgi:hypothetical protein
MKLLLALTAVAVLSGCSTIGGTALNSPVVKNDLASASANFEQAVKLGMLPESDPGVACIRAVVAKAAADVSFTPQVDGLISAGSVAYIAAQVAKKGATIDSQCEALVGRVTIDGAKAARRALVPGLLR